MRSIPEIVANGISTVLELQEALQQAIELEFSTIPPYLCAEWSINTDPQNASGMVHSVVIQEMLHFGLACNLMLAAGGTPSINNSPVIPPSYPCGLPGGVHPDLIISLGPLSTGSLASFMGIEYPDSGPISSLNPPSSPPAPPQPSSPTIGQFYAQITVGFQNLATQISFSTANQISYKLPSGDVVSLVTDLISALAAINEITSQGEGSTQSPDESAPDATELAHYYQFSQIYYGMALVSNSGSWQYASSQPIAMPQVYNMSTAANPSDPNQMQFISDFSTMLDALQACWSAVNGDIGSALSYMYSLQDDAQALIQQQNSTTPLFTYQSSLASPAARSGA
jgi:hypothetical protein